MQIGFFENDRVQAWKSLAESIGKTEELVISRYRTLMDLASTKTQEELYSTSRTSIEETQTDHHYSRGAEEKKRHSSPNVTSTSLKAALRNQPQIKQFFVPLDRSNEPTVGGKENYPESIPNKPEIEKPLIMKSNRKIEFSLQERNSEIDRLRGLLEAKEREHAADKQIIIYKTQESDEVKQQVLSLTKELSLHRDRVANVLEEQIRRTDQALQKYERKEVTAAGFRLGRIVTQKHGFGPRAKQMEIWQDGEAFIQVRHHQLELLQRREEVEKERKRLVGKSSRLKKSSSSSNLAIAELEVFESDEVLRAEVQYMKRREQELSDEKSRLETEKTLHLMSVKRMKEEDNSRFNKQPVLHNRYLLRGLLGKGGFSEVWRAFDLIELRDVAVKIHEMNSSWSEQKKESYLKYATREYRIHLNLDHSKIVQLFDVFEIDTNSFATVIEHCSGSDLDLHLRLRKQLPEREARSILLQILSGLRYLSSGTEIEDGSEKKRPCIIHYDLKPGNILFDGSGKVKITDFGLSKIMEAKDTESTGIELTSMGAGTYWYLPPECFKTGGAPPKISSKVDVWSTGVIFFQMLFGVRPFGEGLTQEKVLSDRTMLQATQVIFPTKPAISNEAKAFIERCLTYSQQYRPDVMTLSQDAYLRIKKL